jgi:predicted phosphodiesterase
MKELDWLVALLGMAFISLLFFGHGHTPEASQTTTIFLNAAR